LTFIQTIQVNQIASSLHKDKIINNNNLLIFII
jgi:hypothetical protein